MSKLQLPIVVTPTRVELANRCHRRHFLSDILGKARYFSPSLEFGTVMHSAFAAHWMNQKAANPTDPFAVIDTEWAKRKVESDDLTPQLAKSMLSDYMAKAQIAGPFTAQGNFKLVDVEQRFELPIRDSRLSFQMDRIVHDPEQNWMVIVDSKTAGRLDSRWDRQWETSIQMKLYRAGAMQVFQTGGRVDIVVEGVLKHAPSDVRYYVCPEWSETLLKEAIHQAYMVASLDRDLVEQASDMVNLADSQGQIQQTLLPNAEKALALGVSMTPINYMDCYSYGVECPFRRICVADVEQRVDIMKAEFFDIQDEGY